MDVRETWCEDSVSPTEQASEGPVGRARPSLSPPPRPRRLPTAVSSSPIIIDGERLTARQALERYPRLREFLDQVNSLSENTVRTKARKYFKEGRIPDGVLHREPEVVHRGGKRLLGNRVVNHYEVLAYGNTSPMDFLNHIRGAVVTFLSENRQNKVQLALVCIMVKVDPVTEEVTAEEQAVFVSKQESVFEAADLESLYGTMTAKILDRKRSRRISRTVAGGC